MTIDRSNRSPENKKQLWPVRYLYSFLDAPDDQSSIMQLPTLTLAENAVVFVTYCLPFKSVDTALDH